MIFHPRMPLNFFKINPMRRLVLISILLSTAVLSIAQCRLNISPSKASYCAGEAVTVSILNPQSGFTYTIQLAGTTIADTIATFYLPGASTTKDYDLIVNQTQNGITLPCNLPYPKIRVLASPDPSLSERNRFKYCNSVTQPTDIEITNTSTTIATNTSYQIDWGDGSPVLNTSTFSSPILHTYQPGRYVIRYTVTGSGTAPCTTVTREYVVILGKAPRVDPSFSPATLCAPTVYSFPLNLDSMSQNYSSTKYSLIVNSQAVGNYTQSNLPGIISVNFAVGSCQANCNGFNKYSVILRATNECGSTDAQTCVPVKDSVRAKIVGEDTICINVNSTYANSQLGKIYQDQGTCESAKVTWDISPATGFNITNGVPYNNNIQTDKNFQVTFTQYGTYLLTMKVFGDCNTADTTFKITVVDPVVADASFTTGGCLPPAGYIDIPFTNNSTGNVQSYQWAVNPTGTSFISGSATSKDVTIRFPRAGSFTVTLSAKGSCNTDTWTGSVAIKGRPNIDTTKIPPACSAPYSFNPSTAFTFDNGGDNTAIYAWSFPGGTPTSSTQRNPGSVIYAASGSYIITLKVTNGCGDSTLSQPFTIFDNIKPDAGLDRTVCKSSGNITLTATPSGGIWRGNGITDSVRGVFDPRRVSAATVNIIYVLNPAAACPTYDTVKINILEIVGLTAGPDQSICKSTGSLQLLSDPLFPNGIWIGIGIINQAQGIFQAAGLSPGIFSVGYIYKDSSGTCTDTAYKNVTVLDSAHITLPPVLCAGQPFNFGTIATNIISALWNFNDGTPNIFALAPLHAYAVPGTYTITLITETAERCKDTSLIPVTVIQNPPLSFITTPDSSCTGVITFSFPSGHDTATNYIWDFGGGNTLQTRVPTSQQYIFTPPIIKDTNYLVTLRADYYCGPSYFTDTIKVKAKPKANFGVQPVGCSPFVPIFANTSYGSPTDYFWDFGNGQTTIISNPFSPTYNNPTRRDSVFTITLKVSNVCGRDSLQKNITVTGNDNYARFFPLNIQGCQPLTDSFFSISSPGSSVIWDFGDGTTSYTSQVTHTYDSAGIFKIKLLAIGACGIDSAFGIAVVYEKPKVLFTYLNACAGQPTQFINQTTNGSSNTWYFGDGTQSTAPNPTHVYASSGAYKVKLIVANNRPCVDSIETTIVVSTLPTADFTVTNPAVCQEEPTIFLNSSVNATNYIWYFGNTETSTANVPTYTYPDAGTYGVSLVAINGQCKDSIFKAASVQIFPKPVADFLYLLTNRGFKDPVAFTNLTLNGVTYFWTFGDGDTSVLTDPIHQYNDVGPYRVTLYVVSSNGCKDTATKALGVDYDGTLYVPNVFSPEVGAGETAIFKPKGLNLKEYRLEIFSTYGQLLWDSDKLEDGKPLEGWDGKYKGTILPQDVYVWKIRAIFNDGRAWEGMKDSKTGKKAVMGSLVLLR